MELFIEELANDGTRCSECRCSHGVHLVTCSQFHCLVCGRSGANADHLGGCPTQRRDEIRWECQCGKDGWMRPTNRSLAGLVRQARREHKCPDPDIVRLESRDEYESRTYHARFHAGVF